MTTTPTGDAGPDSSEISEAPPNGWPPLPVKRLVEDDASFEARVMEFVKENEIPAQKALDVAQLQARQETLVLGYAIPVTAKLVEAFRREAAK